MVYGKRRGGDVPVIMALPRKVSPILSGEQIPVYVVARGPLTVMVVVTVVVVLVARIDVSVDTYVRVIDIVEDTSGGETVTVVVAPMVRVDHTVVGGSVVVCVFVETLVVVRVVTTMVLQVTAVGYNLCLSSRRGLTLCGGTPVYPGSADLIGVKP